jgi:hypothetical protein
MNRGGDLIQGFKAASLGMLYREHRFQLEGNE